MLSICLDLWMSSIKNGCLHLNLFSIVHMIILFTQLSQSSTSTNHTTHLLFFSRWPRPWGWRSVWSLPPHVLCVGWQARVCRDPAKSRGSGQPQRQGGSDNTALGCPQGGCMGIELVDELQLFWAILKHKNKEICQTSSINIIGLAQMCL